MSSKKGNSSNAEKRSIKSGEAHTYSIGWRNIQTDVCGYVVNNKEELQGKTDRHNGVLHNADGFP